ncbi:hypothetical protein EU555_11810 [Methylobacterium nonmethylotrophicum]|uniref:Uncharacterized protein n=1 Tax=Methylobacterium nonmethylotrophicum TaxID=1141884 RepID=A0A4Z0NSF2_9HYPH|nr:hypothetical protein EU555_11810 [Methylobacterium nonmethylotrophicum]
MPSGPDKTRGPPSPVWERGRGIEDPARACGPREGNTLQGEAMSVVLAPVPFEPNPAPSPPSRGIFDPLPLSHTGEGIPRLSGLEDVSGRRPRDTNLPVCSVSMRSDSHHQVIRTPP